MLGAVDTAPTSTLGEFVEQKLYEKIGRQHLQIEEQDAAYTNLLNLLAGIVSGEIDTSRVMVNLTSRMWQVSAEGDRPVLPATINGLPVCVVAPNEQADEQAQIVEFLRGEVARLKGAACQPCSAVAGP